MKGNNYHITKERSEDRIIRFIDNPRTIKMPKPRWEGVFKVPIIDIIMHKAETSGRPVPAFGWGK